MWRHGYTYSGHNTVVAAANVNLDIIQRENLLAEANRLETELATELGPLADHDLVEEVRCGVGALTAVQLTAEAFARNPALPSLVGTKLLEQGVLSRVLFGNSIQVSPPFVMTGEEVKELSDRTRAALDETAHHL